MQDRPELVRDAYVAIARAKLAKGDQMVDGLRELMVEDAFKPFRACAALEFLRDFPDADPYRLDELFDGVFAMPAAHSGFLALADRVLTGALPIGRRQHDMWRAAAYLLSPSRYEAELEAAAKLRPAIVFGWARTAKVSGGVGADAAGSHSRRSAQSSRRPGDRRFWSACCEAKAPPCGSRLDRRATYRPATA